jgi:hypothetical protein
MLRLSTGRRRSSWTASGPARLDPCERRGLEEIALEDLSEKTPME